MIRIFASSSGAERLRNAAEFVRSYAPGTSLLLVGASREGVDDFVRSLSTQSGATFGLHRFSFMQFISYLAMGELAERGLAPATALSVEAVAARSAFQALEQGRIPRFANVTAFPGFARALASTLIDLRMAGIRAQDIQDSVGVDHDLAPLLEIFEENCTTAEIADHAKMLSLARLGLATPQHAALRAMSFVLLDVAIHSRLERDLLRDLFSAVPDALATVPAGDQQTQEALEDIGATSPPTSDPENSGSLARLRLHLFSGEAPPRFEGDEQVRFFSAPGEGRECVEIARLIVEESRRGVDFEDMAVFLRTPETYSALLDTAFRRAGIPPYFARGTKRPDPSGRAFLALLSCKSERLSAKRFSEYLSFAQVPNLNDQGAPPQDRNVWSGPVDEALGAAASAAQSARRVDADVEEAWVQGDLFAARPNRRTEQEIPSPGEQESESMPPKLPAEDTDAIPNLGGTLRAPWKWEELLVEAAVIGGKDRWQRRLVGLDKELRLKLAEIKKEDPESSRLTALERELTNLGHLERFAFPVIDALDGFPKEATWGRWVSLLTDFAPTVLRRPERVLSALAEMQPMASVGPVTVDEVREVLARRLSTLEEDPPAHRYGRVFVATPEQSRVRNFKVVFVPGLAERIFPQRPREDPLLLDALRVQLSDDLRLQEDRGQHERMLLRLAIGAAEERIVLSYPRVDAVEARPRVPSFYALDVARATRGFIPDFEDLEREAADRVKARLAWPAPPRAEMAIDAMEHDLAVLDPLLHTTRPHDTKGRARYLLELNEHLARSLRTRWQRWQKSWSAQDGIVRVTNRTKGALDAHELKERPYSVTALQKYATCPYQFLLSAIHRLEPRREAVALVKLDPLTRGRMFHDIQAQALRALQVASALPVTEERQAQAEAILEEITDRLAEEYREDLAPAILRVWQDEVEEMRSDLRIWLRRMPSQPIPWEPAYFEYSFGLPLRTIQESDLRSGVAAHSAADRAHDPQSLADPVTLGGGWKLRGAVDLIERLGPESTSTLNPFLSALPENLPVDGSGEEVLRVTDHKTGKDRTNADMIVGGGEALQPVLYALAVEAALQRPVVEGRLYFCTTRGGYVERHIPMDERARQYGTMVLDIIDAAIRKGLLMPAPRKDACRWCDFLSVCGPQEDIRSARKHPAPLSKLMQLRSLP